MWCCAPSIGADVVRMPTELVGLKQHTEHHSAALAVPSACERLNYLKTLECASSHLLTLLTPSSSLYFSSTTHSASVCVY